MMVFKVRFLLILVLALLAGCQSGSPGPSPVPSNPTAPTVTLTPASVNVNAGGTPVTFVATVQNSTEAITWVYSGTGTISSASGPATSYTPPASVDSTLSETLTAVLGTTGVSATAPIAVYPAEETPPTEPPPAPPPTEPNPPTTPEPPTNPEPPTMPDMTVTISDVKPVMIGAEGVAGVILNATTNNAPSEDTTYQWSVDGGNSGNVNFNSATSEDTTALISASGDYTLRLTVTSGSVTATDTVSVTVNSAPQTVDGTWSGTFNVGETANAFTLELDQTAGNVTGTWVYIQNVPVTGTFDGRTLTLTGTFANTPITFNATVVEDTMEGTIANPSESFPFAATR